MKVLHVIDRLAVGGAEQVFVNLTGNLLGVDIGVGAMLFNTGYPLERKLAIKKEVTQYLDGNTRTAIKSLKVHDLKRASKFSIRTLYKAYRICTEYDIVHAHLRHVHAYLKLAKMIFGGSYKLLLHDHAGVTQEVPFRLKGLFKPKYYIGVNNEQLNWATEQIKVAKRHVYLLTNTIAPLNAIDGVADDGSIMMIANVRRVKHIEFAIKLCQHMGRKLTVYGNVLDEDYYNELKMLGGNVRFVTGAADIPAIFQQHSLAIHTSKEETGPLVLLEYMCAGMPFVSYKTGSVADTIYNEFPDAFVNDFDIERWVQRVNEVRYSEEQKKLSRLLYLKYFSPERIREQCLKIYKDVRS